MGHKVLFVVPRTHIMLTSFSFSRELLLIISFNGIMWSCHF